MNRRKFLKNSTKQLAVLNVMGLTTTSILTGNVHSNKHSIMGKEQGNIIYRDLGKTGIKVPIVSMGVMNASNPNLLKEAWNKGIRHFDTAWNYQNGNNERMIGSALRELNVKREDVIIATKIPPSGGNGQTSLSPKENKELFLKRFDECLSRLQMDYVDILYYHHPNTIEEAYDPYIIEAFNELKESKKIRFTGYTSHAYWPEMVTETAKRKYYDVLLLAFNYAMFQDDKIFNALKVANNAGIGLVAMKTQCKNDWYKRSQSAEIQKLYENTMNGALLKWVLRHDYMATAVPGFTTFQQLEEDMVVAYDLNYSKEEEEFFQSRDIQLAIQSVCRHCGNCVQTCPHKADIPSLMRTHMYSLSYGNPLMAKQTLAQIPQDKGLDICKDCDECTSLCKNRVPIAERIHELKEIYC
jgi:uncharacterized protein